VYVARDVTAWGDNDLGHDQAVAWSDGDVDPTQDGCGDVSGAGRGVGRRRAILGINAGRNETQQHDDDECMNE
jgi:hypothetical protein